MNHLVGELIVVRNCYDLPTFCTHTLPQYYLRGGVKFKRPEYRYWKSYTEEDSDL